MVYYVSSPKSTGKKPTSHHLTMFDRATKRRRQLFSYPIKEGEEPGEVLGVCLSWLVLSQLGSSNILRQRASEVNNSVLYLSELTWNWRRPPSTSSSHSQHQTTPIGDSLCQIWERHKHLKTEGGEILIASFVRCHFFATNSHFSG